MKSLIVVIIVAVQVAISSAYLRSRVTTEHGTLSLEARQKRGSHARIKGAFHSEEGQGIRFETSLNSLEVTAMDGQTLVKTSKFPVTVQTYGGGHQGTVFHFLDDAYIESNKQVYRFLGRNVDMAVFSARGKRQLTQSQLLASLQVEKLNDPQAAIQASVERLVAHPATTLLEPAARALGEDLGIIGKDEPAAMPFYTTAMRLTEARDKILLAQASSFWNFFKPKPKSKAKYPNCNLKTCPPCKDDECMGLCGRKCSCWVWLCGDCCLHRGCELHDICCRKYGFFSTGCLFPSGLTCSDYKC